MVWDFLQWACRNKEISRTFRQDDRLLTLSFDGSPRAAAARKTLLGHYSKKFCRLPKTAKSRKKQQKSSGVTASCWSTIVINIVQPTTTQQAFLGCKAQQKGSKESQLWLGAAFHPWRLARETRCLKFVVFIFGVSFEIGLGGGGGGPHCIGWQASKRNSWLLNSEVAAAARARVGSLRRSATVTGQASHRCCRPTGGCYLSVRVTCSAAATPLPPHFVAAAIDVADAE